ncbi:MAG: DUF721 domain-containing protein, partial [Myxococcota bacterium]
MTKRSGGKRRRSKPTALKDLVRKAHPVPHHVDLARILAWWCQALPPRIASRARPVRFQHRILYVNTVSSTWAQELSFMSTDLLVRLRGASLGVTIEGLRFRTGPLPPPFERRTKKRVRRPLVTEPLPMSVGRALARISDDGLRDA